MRRDFILIADDDPIGLSAYAALLASDSYEIETAPDGPTALKIARERRPDVILLDVMMPGMDGFEVTRLLRGMPDLAEVPILILTALDDLRSRLTALEAGADDFISKPVDRIEMRARLRSITRLNRFRRLTEQRERSQHLFSRAPCGLMVLTADGLVQEANPAATQLLRRWLGPPPHNLGRLLSENATAQFAHLLASAGEQAEATAQQEFIARVDGSRIWFELSVSRLSADAGTFLVALTDRTGERSLEQQLQQAQKLESIGQLAGGIAHDFNNLLTVINGFTAMTIEQMPPGDAQRDGLEQVYRAGEQAAALTRQLLAFGRRAVVTPVHVSLPAAVRESEKMLRRLIGEHIAVSVTAQPPTGVVWADPTQIEQILFNLAANARDAMPAGGRLDIDVSEVADADPAAGRWVRLTVADTGCGMPPEILERAFEPFFTTKPVGKGTGLGLATVHGIVKQCGGRVQVNSVVGSGTTFIIDLPRLDAPAAAETAAAAPRRAQGTETVLVAEDEGVVRTFAEAALVKAGYTVLTAYDGTDALAKAAAHPGPIHLLFTDAVMPRLGGRGLAERLLQSRPEVKILGTSGYDDDAVAQHAGPTVTAAFLQKPYTGRQLLEAVRDLLDR